MPSAGPGVENYVPSIVFDAYGVPTSSQALPNNVVSGGNQTLQPAMNDPAALGYAPNVKSPNTSSKGKDLLYR